LTIREFLYQQLFTSNCKHSDLVNCMNAIQLHEIGSGVWWFLPSSVLGEMTKEFKALFS
jgi:hypothetical protein